MNMDMFFIGGCSITEDYQVYYWFLINGYAENVDKRFSNFNTLSDKDKITVLKESLVEDYRIGLNQLYNNGMFILPNVISYYGDFHDPLLLKEGVSIVNKMLEQAINGQAKLRQNGFSSEIDRIQMANIIHERAIQSNWTPGHPSMSKSDHEAVLMRLMPSFSKVAAANQL